MFSKGVSYEARIPLGKFFLSGILEIPENAKKIVIFVHGSGSSRLSPRNALVARHLCKKGMGTLLVDLLTLAEDENYSKRFDIPMLAQRIKYITGWLFNELEDKECSFGYFGASTGAAAALVAAIQSPVPIKAIVSRGGRPDLAIDILPAISCPTLFIVGGDDTEVIDLNKEAFAKLSCVKDLAIIPGATHLFEEPGTLEQVADMAAEWFEKYL